jgi:BRCT domain type II-containing protein
MEVEIQQKKFEELHAKPMNMKIKDVFVRENKSRKATTTSKSSRSSTRPTKWFGKMKVKTLY